MRSAAIVGLSFAVVGLLGGCHWHRNDEDLVVENETLVSRNGGCVVQGTARNDHGHSVRAELVWRAFDDDDDEIGTADTEIRDLARDETRSFESTRFREFDRHRLQCSEIHKIRRSEFVTRE